MLTTSVAEKDARRLTARRDRYQAQHALWRHSSLQRVAYCGRFEHDKDRGISIRVSGSTADGTRRAGFSGLQTCGSVWACAVCSEKVNAERQSELQAGIEAWTGAGHAVVFGTLTLRHHKRQTLADLWDAIGPAWNRTTSGAGVAWNGSKVRGRDIGDKARFGIRGIVRVVETKHGANGWHPHVHFLLFLDTAISTEALRDLEGRMFGRWESALAREGLSVVREVGIDLRPVQSGDALADYFTKSTYATTASGAAYEVTGSQSKRAGKGGRTPFDILRDIVARGAERLDVATGEIVPIASPEDLALWHEWEKASRGRRQLTWTRGLRELLALGVEKTDEEIAEEEHGGEELEDLHDWRGSGLCWRKADLLEAAEGDDTGERLATMLNALLAARPPKPLPDTVIYGSR